MDAMRDVVVIVVGAAAFVSAVKIITGWRPIVWIFTRLIHDPAAEAVQRIIMAEVVPKLDALQEELRVNGGATLRDAVNRIEEKQIVTTQHFDTRMDELERRVDDILPDP